MSCRSRRGIIIDVLSGSARPFSRGSAAGPAAGFMAEPHGSVLPAPQPPHFGDLLSVAGRDSSR